MHTSQLPPRPQAIVRPTMEHPPQEFSYDQQNHQVRQNAQRFGQAWEADRTWSERMTAELYARGPPVDQSAYIQQLQAQAQAQAQIHQHRVYTLNCSTCHTFLSDRGMRAVLLLKPSITLFSTDAAPMHSGPQYAEENMAPEAVERTCDCLTQSLACYGCGSTIGYQIIAPCATCTQSVSQHAKSANGHRYVFHYRAVYAKERKYREGEPGVVNQPMLSSGLRVARPGEAVMQPVAINVTETSQFQFIPRRPRSNTLCGENDVAAPVFANAAQVSRNQRCWLREGDTVYWHHLRMGGERVTPVDPDVAVFKMPVCGR